MPTPPPADDQPSVETLRLIYDDLVRERDRLRDARRAVTAQLGPLPASAGIIVSLFAAFLPQGGSPAYSILLGFALIPFVLILVLSSRASRRDPYRSMRKPAAEMSEKSLSERAWLIERIAAERTHYGGREEEPPPPSADHLASFGASARRDPLRLLIERLREEWRLAPPEAGMERRAYSLTQHFDAERRSLRFIQGLLGAEVVYLVLVTLLARASA